MINYSHLGLFLGKNMLLSFTAFTFPGVHSSNVLYNTLEKLSKYIFKRTLVLEVDVNSIKVYNQLSTPIYFSFSITLLRVLIITKNDDINFGKNNYIWHDQYLRLKTWV